MKIHVKIIKTNDHGGKYEEHLLTYISEIIPQKGELLVPENFGPFYKVSGVVNHIWGESQHVEIYVYQLNGSPIEDEIFK